ncbi:TonB-dependent receptor plug domain-containing protein [Hydrocarboniphaga effusa]|uniref:TonB-dependent receptor plug domain-containing protein n=1 Tax=Hydrocarboniphaga effusa TaxID=243629 RepID=UPI003137909F
MVPVNSKLLKQGGGSLVAGLLGVASLSVPQSALAQSAPAESEAVEVAQAAAPAAATAAESTAAIEEVVITGTRVVRDGYQAPTPVSVIGVEQMQSFASPNIADAVRTLPAISSGSSPTTSVSTASTGNSNINALNLRSLGENRTLVLVDGQRSVASSLSGLVDVNLIPQDLVQRVEVVTGGASAQYGSDALGGVVNFVLDKKFTGLKTNTQYGATTHGDGDNALASLTYGTPFGEGRGHFIFSGSYRWQDVIPVNTRDWNLEGWQFMNNPTYSVGGVLTGQPQRLLLDRVSCSTCIAGGIIVGGQQLYTNAQGQILRRNVQTSLRGTAWGQGGTPYQFEFGDLVSDPDMRGGDWQSTQVRGSPAGTSLSGGSRTASLFTRGSWALTDSINVFAQAAYARDKNRNYSFSTEDTGGITLARDNAFLSDEIKSIMAAQSLDFIRIGSQHPDIPITQPTNTREVTRLVLGADGKFGDGWSWDAYYQHGISKLENVAKYITANANMTRAYDAVINPANGAIVCRSTLTDPTNGCKPYNPMGFGVNTQQAIDYVTGDGQQMWREQQLTQNVAAFAVSGSPFSTWAGDVSVATGIEWRQEEVGKGKNDAISNTGPAGGWWVGGYRPSKGGYTVREAFVETVVPVLKDLPLFQYVDLSGAVRATDYSTSGNVETWKVGLNWTLIDDLRFRGSLSHDIRAPNLEELYSNGSGGAPAITNPWILDNGAPITESISSPRIGNPELTPEIADSYGLGFVLSPRFLPGFNFSVDYWHIDIEDSIGLPTTQDIINGCFNGQTDFCSAISFADGSRNILAVNRTPFNYTSQVASGIDLEASYVFDPSAIIASIPGTVQLRAMATNYRKNATTINGVVNDTAGENTSVGPPNWKWNASVNYSLENIRASVMARGISAGVYDNDWIVCSSNCPASDPKFVTVSDNRIPSAIFWDTSFTYGFDYGSSKIEAYLNMRNVFDRDPPIVAAAPGGFSYTIAPANAQLYDVLGRTFTVGFRTSF